jgi:RimJ/RimL family protein N-acetyltransferase
MLTSNGITLRALTPADYPRLVGAYNDVELELLGGGRPPRPVTLAMVTDTFDDVVKDTQAFTFAIEIDGTFVGTCGLTNLNRVNGTAELGIGIFDRAFLGVGHGRQVLRLLLDYGFDLQNLRRIWLEVHATNERAVRAYRAVGFVQEGRLREHVWSGGRYDDLVQMGLLRSEWRSADSGRGTPVP